MTNDDIENEASLIYGMAEGDIAARLRYLVAQVREEAAAKNDALAHDKSEQCSEGCAHACMSLRVAAKQIRALKDSLVESPVSSLS